MENQRIVQVNNVNYTVFSDFIDRATYAVNPAGIKKVLRSSGYLSNEKSVIKAIKNVFQEEPAN